MSTIQADIEARLAEAEPDVEVLLAEVVGAGTLRVFIDDPNGVSLALEKTRSYAKSFEMASRPQTPWSRRFSSWSAPEEVRVEGPDERALVYRGGETIEWRVVSH